MTTLRGLAAVRESIGISLEGDPAPDELAYLVRAAAEHYAAIYSKIPPGLLYEEVFDTRSSVLRSPEQGSELRAACGWLTALLGNLSFHLNDPAEARLHLASAAGVGRRHEDADLWAWSSGALAMVARSDRDDAAALTLGRRAVDSAPPGLRRAQMLMWAYLPALAARGDAEAADETIAEANRQLEAAPHPELPGRFGFDLAERNLHEADAHLLLGRHDRAGRIAEASVAASVPNSPGWAAASLLLAQAESAQNPADAIARAQDVLNQIPADRLRATARGRLTALSVELSARDARATDGLREQVRALAPLVDEFGSPLVS